MLTTTCDIGAGGADFLQRRMWLQLVAWSDLTASPLDFQLTLAARPQILAACGPADRTRALWCLRETHYSSKLGGSESQCVGRRSTAPKREVPALGVSEFRLGAACVLLLLGQPSIPGSEGARGGWTAGLKEAAPLWPRIQPLEPEDRPLWGLGQPMACRVLAPRSSCTHQNLWK